MDKIIFCWILQCALLSYDGISYEKMVNEYGADPTEAKSGIKLYEYLNKFEVKQ